MGALLLQPSQDRLYQVRLRALLRCLAGTLPVVLLGGSLVVKGEFITLLTGSLVERRIFGNRDDLLVLSQASIFRNHAALYFRFLVGLVGVSI